MKKQIQTTKYPRQGFSHEHLFHLFEKYHIPTDHPDLHHHNQHHNQELSYCPLFRGMTQQEHDEFLDRNVREILTYSKGEIVVRQGDPIRSVMLLVQGSVRTEMITLEGNVLDIDILEAVIPLAPSFIYGAKNNYPVDVIAVETTIFLTNKLQMISLKSLRKKLATFFLEKTTAENGSFVLKRSRTQLAEYFGVQRQSLARSLKEMEDEGIILLKGREIQILDRSRLIRE